MKLTQQLICLVAILATLSSCKKEKSENSVKVASVREVIHDTDRTVFSYDNAGRLYQKKYFNGGTNSYYDLETFYYDNADHITKIIGVDDSTAFSYNNKAQLLKTEKTKAYKSKSHYLESRFLYGYDNNGRVAYTEYTSFQPPAIDSYQRTWRYSYEYSSEGLISKIIYKEMFDSYYTDEIVLEGYSEEFTINAWAVEKILGSEFGLSAPVLAGLKKFPRNFKTVYNGTVLYSQTFDLEIANKQLNKVTSSFISVTYPPTNSKYELKY